MNKTIQEIPQRVHPEYELTGEYRVPQEALGDLWAPLYCSVIEVMTFTKSHKPHPSEFEGRRWILRKKSNPNDFVIAFCDNGKMRYWLQIGHGNTETKSLAHRFSKEEATHFLKGNPKLFLQFS